MRRKIHLSRYAWKFATRFPILNYLLLQITFWVTSYVFLALLTHFILLTAGASFEGKVTLRGSLIVALFFGVSNGIISGLVDQLFERRFFYNRALLLVIIAKAIVYFIVFVILISLVRFTIYPSLQPNFFEKISAADLETSWEHFFQLMLLYNIVSGLVIIFVNIVNKKYGPGVLFPLLLGKFRKPREENRIFLFMDLKSSTAIAEALGHLKYSAFIRDSFLDINSVIGSHNAQVYQYAGDEIVVTWYMEKGKLPIYCVRFFFACEEKFRNRSKHYMKQYGRLPEFKAGLHMGTVTAVEVGEVKRDIAYHGDTLNTAARIQGICNQYNKVFLTSGYVLENSDVEKYYRTESIGLIQLKGKKQTVEIAGIIGVKEK